jgi:hypothetical protein
MATAIIPVVGRPGAFAFAVGRAHRWFAVECNNRAWDLVEKSDRTVEETERMIHAAHAALWHWRKVGTEINHLRARCLLATAYLAANDCDTAVRYADQCVELSEQLGDAQTTFDRAMVYGSASRAHQERVSVFRELANH